MAGMLAGPVFLADALWIDFVNTRLQDSSGPRDFADTTSAMLDWLVAAGTLTDLERRRVSKATASKWLLEAGAFRDSLRDMANSVARGDVIPKSSVQVVNRILGERKGYFQLVDEQGGYREQFLVSEPISPLSAVAHSAAQFIAEGDHAMVKRCANGACVLLFYDTTKNHRRRFCSAEGCGNRMKVAAHYRRKREAAADGIVTPRF